MKLWTKEIETIAKKYPLCSQENKGKNSTIIVKYYNPYGNGTWLITEAEKLKNGDWLLFGYFYLYEWEWNYITLSEIKNIKINVFGKKLHLQRDNSILENITIRELLRGKYGN